MNAKLKEALLDQFDPRARAYPFIDGEIAPGITVTDQTVQFKGQRGPIQEVGSNGCQIDDVIKFARLTIEVFNTHFPCRENALAITKLQEAEMWLQQRTADRRERNVEGKNER